MLIFFKLKSYNNFLSRQIDFTFFINKKNIWHTCRPRKWTLKCGVCAILEWWNSKFSRYYYMSLAQEGERRNNSAQLTEFAVNLIGNALKSKCWIEPKPNQASINQNWTHEPTQTLKKSRTSSNPNEFWPNTILRSIWR